MLLRSWRRGRRHMRGATRPFGAWWNEMRTSKRQKYDHHRIPRSTVVFSTRYTKKPVIAPRYLLCSRHARGRLRNKQSSTTSPVAAKAPVTSAKGPIRPRPASARSVRSSSEPQKATTMMRMEDVSGSSSSSSSSSSSLSRSSQIDVLQCFVQRRRRRFSSEPSARGRAAVGALEALEHLYAIDIILVIDGFFGGKGLLLRRRRLLITFLWCVAALSRSSNS